MPRHALLYLPPPRTCPLSIASSHPVLKRARDLLGHDPAAAAVLAQRLVAEHPGAIEPRFILGAAQRRCGQATAALPILGVLAGERPGAWGIHYEHGMALALDDQAEAAVAALTRATRANPAATLAWHALADQLGLLGRDEAAKAALAAAMKSGLADPALAATVTASLDGVAAARAALRARFGLDSSDIAATCLLAEIGLREDRPDAVARSLEAAIAGEPPYLPARHRLALALHRLDRDDAALTAIDPVVAAGPQVAPLRALRAAILMRLGREAAAADDFAVATVLAPDEAMPWHGYGHALRALGRQAEAVAAYRRAIDLAPALGEAWWSLANLKTWRFDASDLSRMTALLADPGLSSRDRSYLHFALGKAMEDGGDDAAAFAHYRTGNALRRQTLPWDAAAHRDFVERTIATCTPDFFAARHDAGMPSTAPIFVLGLPRSGSTLVEQILASHGAVEGASELPDITALARGLAAGTERPYPALLADMSPADLAVLGEAYLTRTRHRRVLGRAHFVDKFPGNFLHIPLIHLMFPHAAIIDVRRDPRAVCVSLFRQSFADGQAYSYDLADLGHYYVAYERLMRHLDTVLPGRVLHVSYEALIDDAVGQTQRLLDHVGVPFDPACLRFFENGRAVRTPSSEQVRRPIYRDRLDQWRRFDSWLGPLFEALGPVGSPGPAPG